LTLSKRHGATAYGQNIRTRFYSGIYAPAAEAREVYGWFTEGFDTADLQAAKVLLEALP
jgi:hypothetical protein